MADRKYIPYGVPFLSSPLTFLVMSFMSPTGYAETKEISLNARPIPGEAIFAFSGEDNAEFLSDGSLLFAQDHELIVQKNGEEVRRFSLGGRFYIERTRHQSVVASSLYDNDFTLVHVPSGRTAKFQMKYGETEGTDDVILIPGKNHVKIVDLVHGRLQTVPTKGPSSSLNKISSYSNLGNQLYRIGEMNQFIAVSGKNEISSFELDKLSPARDCSTIDGTIFLCRGGRRPTADSSSSKSIRD